MNLPHASDNPTWLGLLGIVSPILLAVIIWGASVEAHNAKADLARQVFITEMKRLESRIDNLKAEVDRIKDQR